MEKLPIEITAIHNGTRHSTRNKSKIDAEICTRKIMSYFTISTRARGELDSCHERFQEFMQHKNMRALSIDDQYYDVRL